MMENVKRLFWLWQQCFKSMKNMKTFIPFVIYALLQGVLLYSLVNFIKSPFSGLFIPLIRKIFGEPALHYPNFFYVITPFFNQINLIIGGLIGVIIIAMATIIFTKNFRNESAGIGESISISFSKYISLFIVWIIESVLTITIIVGIPMLLNKFLQPEYRVSQIIEFGSLILGILVASIFAFTTILIVVDGEKFGRSLSRTFLIFRNNIITTFMLVAVPTLIYFPVSYLSKKTNILISKFSPEIMVVILSTGILITLFTSYFQIGSITRFYLLLTEKRRY